MLKKDFKIILPDNLKELEDFLKSYGNDFEIIDNGNLIEVSGFFKVNIYLVFLKRTSNLCYYEVNENGSINNGIQEVNE